MEVMEKLGVMVVYEVATLLKLVGAPGMRVVGERAVICCLRPTILLSRTSTMKGRRNEQTNNV